MNPGAANLRSWTNKRSRPAPPPAIRTSNAEEVKRISQFQKDEGST